MKKNKLKRKLLINQSLNRIQQIRLIHALTESSFDISVPASEKPKFDVLKDQFGLYLFSPDSDCFDITQHINISHSVPLTSLGKISKPLIFSHSITDYCYSLWKDHRDYRYSFQGLLTHKRKLLIEDWIQQNILKTKISLPSEADLMVKLRNKIFRKMGFDDTVKTKVGDLLLVSSKKGRKFPIKAWDKDYFKILANSQFVLCPSGDYVWSYRFFESTLCGAIPIVEETCSAYEGFRFASFEDEARNLTWSAEVAEHNYNVCIEKLTVPKTVLDSEIQRIINSNGSEC